MNKISSVVPSPPSAADYPYIPVAGPLPDFITVRQFAGDRKDQLQEGACVGNSVANACELIEMHADTAEPPDLSRQFVYDVGRIWENRKGQGGMYQRDALDVARKVGIPLESDYPYRGDETTVDPDPSVYPLAAQRKLMRYELLDLSQSPDQYVNDFSNAERAIKSALFEGCPVIISFYVGKKIFDVSGPLAQQDYPPLGPDTPSEGGHDVVIEEWSKALGGFVFENSWNRSWGDDGFGLLKTPVLQNVFEARAVRGFNGHYIQPQFVTADQIKAFVEGVAAMNGGYTVPACETIWLAMNKYGFTAAYLEFVMGWPVGSVNQYAKNHGWL